MPESDGIRQYLARVQPCFYELFRMAYAVTGSLPMAHGALQTAILDVYRARDEVVSVRESLKKTVLEHASDLRGNSSEEEYPDEWTGFELLESADEAFMWVSREKLETRRLLVLRYGCSLNTGEIAELLGVPRQQVRRQLSRVRARFERAMRHMPFDRAMARAAKRELTRPDAIAPDTGALLRAFEMEAQQVAQRSFSPRGAVRTALRALLALLLAGAFWLFASLIHHPAPQHAPSLGVEPADAEIIDN